MEEFKRLINIATTKESDPSKEDLFSILFVLKQILGLILGLVAGLLHLTGIPVILGFAVISYLVSYTYPMKYLQMDEETVEILDIFKESFMPSFMLFLLSWILSYSFTL